MNGAPQPPHGAWDQFLIGKRKLLASYREALAHSMQLPVKTHHGVVGEAAVREWLEAFLPKRYGITSGYIRGQRLHTPFDFAHFDVIVYEQIEAPVLWIESNPDRSDSGRKRIISAEHVRAVFEIKARFNRRTVQESVNKLSELGELMAKIDQVGERYPTYLPLNAVLVMMFFELREEDKKDVAALDALSVSRAFPRVSYGPVILSGDGWSEDYTALVRNSISDQPLERPEGSPDQGLLSGLYLSETREESGLNIGSMLTWSPMHFSDFAFDVLALMNGTYQHGLVSSFHGVDFAKYVRPGQSA